MPENLLPHHACGTFCHYYIILNEARDRSLYATLPLVMARDPFDDLLELENEYYKQGLEAGVADSAYAGLIEGKTFGIEKGYEKVIELGKLHGRAVIWKRRLDNSPASGNDAAPVPETQDIQDLSSNMSALPNNARLRKHVEAVLILTDHQHIPCGNTDEAVADVEDRIAKTRSRVKMIMTLVGENVGHTSSSDTGIEDSTGLSARH